jgi:hypothetical protein
MYCIESGHILLKISHSAAIISEVVLFVDTCQMPTVYTLFL